jgi:hypothetical protein
MESLVISCVISGRYNLQEPNDFSQRYINVQESVKQCLSCEVRTCVPNEVFLVFRSTFSP